MILVWLELIALLLFYVLLKKIIRIEIQILMNRPILLAIFIKFLTYSLLLCIASNRFLVKNSQFLRIFVFHILDSVPKTFYSTLLLNLLYELSLTIDSNLNLTFTSTS